MKRFEINLAVGSLILGVGIMQLAVDNYDLAIADFLLGIFNLVFWRVNRNR